MHRRPALVLGVALALAGGLAACGDDDGDDRADRRGRGGWTTYPLTSDTESTGDDTTTTTSAPGGAPPTTTRASGSSSVGGSGRASTTTVATTPPPTAGAPLASSSVRPTQPGNYGFDNRGTTKLRTCFTYDYPTPATSTLHVDAPNGNRQQLVLSNDDATTTTVLEFQPGGIHLAFLRQEQPTPSGMFVSEFEPVPPVLAVPASPTVGQSWSFTLVSKDGQVTTETTRRVDALAENVTLGDGSPVSGVRVHTTAHITGTSPFGPLDLQLTSVSHQSLEHRLLLRDVTDTKGKVGACDYESHVESTLRSTRPS